MGPTWVLPQNQHRQNEKTGQMADNAHGADISADGQERECNPCAMAEQAVFQGITADARAGCVSRVSS
jgi:hypothetical protein